MFELVDDVVVFESVVELFCVRTYFSVPVNLFLHDNINLICANFVTTLSCAITIADPDLHLQKDNLTFTHFSLREKYRLM